MPSRITGVYPFNNMDAAEAKEYLAGIRSLLYVAITRAREQVYIIGYGDPCELLK